MTEARGLLDTSVFIASESGRALDETRVPAEVATSVVTQDDDFEPIDGVADLSAVRV